MRPCLSVVLYQYVIQTAAQGDCSGNHVLVEIAMLTDAALFPPASRTA
jgi:hypothetical protein